MTNLNKLVYNSYNMENKTTINELRNILFAVENQKMTVKELRTALFNVSDAINGKELNYNNLCRIISHATK